MAACPTGAGRTGWPRPFARFRGSLGACSPRGFVASASADVVLDPDLGALGLGLGRYSRHVGEACLLQVKSVSRVGCVLRCFLGPVVGHLVALGSIVQ